MMDLEALLNPYVFFALLMAVLVFYTQWFEYPVSSLKPLPGPRAWSILGNLPQLIAARLDITGFHEGLRKMYGAVVGYRISGRHVVVISDLKLVREAADHPDICGRMRDELHENLSEDSNVGILTSYGQTWKEHHDVLAGFAKELSKNQQLKEICSKEAAKLVKVLTDENGKDITIHRHSVQAFASIFSQVIFGKSLQKTVLKELVDIVLERQKKTPSAVRPLLPSFVNNLPGSGARKRRQLDVQLVNLVKELVDCHSKQMAGTTSCFLKKYQEEGQEKLRQMETGSVAALTTYNLIWACIDLVSVCVDQASLRFSQSLLLLALHQDVQSKLLEDICLEAKQPDDQESSAYLAAVQLETQRLASDNPWSMSLIAQSDVTLGEFEIPQGAVVVANGIYLRQGDDQGWKEPTHFQPGRFLDEDGALVERPQMMSFPAGKRACPTEVMASSASSILLRNVCQRFKLRSEAKIHLLESNGIIQRNALFGANLQAVPR